MIVADYIDPDLAAGADIEIDEYSYVKTVERRDIWFSLGIILDDMWKKCNKGEWQIHGSCIW